MIKAQGGEHCSWKNCNRGPARHGETMCEGTMITEDADALYHLDCYIELIAAEDAAATLMRFEEERRLMQ